MILIDCLERIYQDQGDDLFLDQILFVFVFLISLFHNRRNKLLPSINSLGLILQLRMQQNILNLCHHLLHFVIRILSSAFFYLHFIIRILPSAFSHPHFIIRHPPSGPHFAETHPLHAGEWDCGSTLSSTLIYYSFFPLPEH